MFLKLIELTIVIVGLGFTVYFSYRTSRVAVKQFTIEYLERFAEKVAKNRKILRTYLPKEMQERCRIEPEAVTRVWADDNARNATKSYLNAYNRSARDILEGNVDRGLALAAQRRNVVTAYMRFSYLIEMRRAEGRKSWLSLERFYHRYGDAQLLEE